MRVHCAVLESDEITMFFMGASVSSEFGPLLNPRLCVYSLGNTMPIKYKWQVWFHAVASGECSFENTEAVLGSSFSYVRIQTMPWDQQLSIY